MQCTILVVDDDAANLRVLSALLKDDFKVVIAKSGENAISIAQQSLPNLILLDVLMPDMSGFEVIEQLKSNPITSHIPVIFITGLNSYSDERLGLTLGANDYIHKPFHPDIFKARINNQLKTLKRHDMLKSMAHLDPLTELPNRRKWQDDIKTLLNKPASCDSFIAVGILDLDDFKAFNDYYGHLAGDETLLTAAKTIQSVVMKYNGQLYRFGGEEFVFALAQTSTHELEMCISEICPAINALEIEHKGSSVSSVLTLSGGVSIHQFDHPVTSRTLLHEADNLLYKAKQQGKNRILSTYSFTEQQQAHDL